MPEFLCVVCGTRYPESASPPPACPICQDERQWVRWAGQAWLDASELAATHHNVFREEDKNVCGIGTEPAFAIGQRALLLLRPEGNVLWDCISLVDAATVAEIQARGGLAAIAISHPHFFSAMVAWSEAFGGVPVYLHETHRPHVVSPHPCIRFWSGDRHSLAPDLTLVRVGGHYEGSTVLHWSRAAAGHGALCPGDSIRVAQDRDQLAFMYSYVNFIPLSARRVQAIWDAVADLPFERIYGYWFDFKVMTDAKAKLHRSVRRYLAALAD